LFPEKQHLFYSIPRTDAVAIYPMNGLANDGEIPSMFSHFHLVPNQFLYHISPFPAFLQQFSVSFAKTEQKSDCIDVKK
jgi:hypothetical protein